MRNGNEVIGSILKEFSGPFGGEVSGAASLFAGEEFSVKALGRNAPGFPGAIARAVDAERTGLTDTKGARLLRNEQGNVRDANRWEVYAIAAGFSLTEVTHLRSMKASERDQVVYWGKRRMDLKKQFWEARRDRDSETETLLWKSLKDFNADIPERELMLTGKEIGQYIKSRRRAILKEERGIVPKRWRGTVRDVEDAYSENN